MRIQVKISKLGGYSNAEEKQFQAIAKRSSINSLQKHFPNYVPKNQIRLSSSDNSNAITKLNRNQK